MLTGPNGKGGMERSIFLQSIRVICLGLSFNDTRNFAVGRRAMNLVDGLALSTITRLPAHTAKPPAVVSTETVGSGVINSLPATERREYTAIMYKTESLR
ncbi:hypothetical protein ACMYSQ_001333 [Aspergillus niger]